MGLETYRRKRNFERTPEPEGRVTRRAKAKQKSRPVAAGRALKAKELEGDVDLKVGKEIVALTSLDKIYWPDDGYTKGDLIRYYYEIAKYILPYLKDRPLILKRYPNGIDKPSFHQHDVDEAPDYARTVAIDVSARPRPGATVSAPLDWAEVKRAKLSPQDFTIQNMRKRIERRGDLFEPVLKLKQRLGPEDALWRF